MSKSKAHPVNLIHSIDATHCNRIMHGGESHFPKLKSQEEIDADASSPLFLGMMRLLAKVRKSLRSSWQ